MKMECHSCSVPETRQATCELEECERFHTLCRSMNKSGCPTCRMMDRWRGQSIPVAFRNAREFAIEAHGDQRYGKYPYAYHLDAVAEIIFLGWSNACFGVTNLYPVSAVDCVGFVPVRGLEEMLILAYLHDVIEDGQVGSVVLLPPFDSKESYKSMARGCMNGGIASRFGERMASLAWLVTDCEGYPRAKRKQDTNEKLRNVKPEHNAALIVKAADRLANVRFSVKTKDAKSRSMLKRYRAEHEAFRAAAFRPGLCDPIWEEMDGIMLVEAKK